MIFRFLLATGGLIFTIEHPYFVALSSVLYLFSQYIEEDEIVMLKEFANKGSVWISKLNSFSRTHDFSMREGREVASDLITDFFSNLTKEQIKLFNSNDRIKEKVNRLIVDELNQEESSEANWESFPLNDADLLDGEEKEFISYLSPKFNWNTPYTFKEHRQLFKTLKSKFRNTDGTIFDEIGSRTVNELERWVYGFMTNTPVYSYGEDLEIVDYLLNAPYKK